MGMASSNERVSIENMSWSKSQYSLAEFVESFQLPQVVCVETAGIAVARTLIGGCIFIYSGSVRLTFFEINFISKETSRAEPEPPPPPPPPISVLATALTAGYLIGDEETSLSSGQVIQLHSVKNRKKIFCMARNHGNASLIFCSIHI